jgi:Rod binding domain-containing protein
MKVAAQHFSPLNRKDGCEGISTRKSSASLNPEQAKLKKACENFDAIFISYMLKTMRQESEKSGLFGDGLGSDIYKEMFDEKLAEKMSESGQMKIGDILYKQYVPLINASKRTKSLKMAGPQLEKATTKIDPAPGHKSNLDKPKAEVKAPVETKKPEAAKPASEAPKKIADTKEAHPLLSKFEDMISQAATKFGLEPALLKAVIQHESGGDPNAVSPDGAKGLMQLVDSTAKMMGVVDPFNPIENIMGGAKYISQLWDRFGGDLKKVIASYNAGPGAVEKFDGVPPYQETRNYVDKVLATYDMENKGS